MSLSYEFNDCELLELTSHMLSSPLLLPHVTAMSLMRFQNFEITTEIGGKFAPRGALIGARICRVESREIKEREFSPSREEGR